MKIPKKMKCPGCEKEIREVDIEDIAASNGFGNPKIPCNAFLCPSCQAIISVQIDPYVVITSLKKHLDLQFEASLKQTRKDLKAAEERMIQAATSRR